MNRSVLVSDFDGTITGHDFYSLVVQDSMPRDAPDPFALYAAGKLTHFEAMASIFAWTPTGEAALEDLLRRTVPDPDLRAAADCLERNGWDLRVVSAGCTWYIERVFRAAGAAVPEIHANPGRIEPGRGLVLELPRDSRFFCPDVGIDKSAVVEDSLRRYDRVAFAGDGPQDVKPALRVAPELRFARGYLARELRKRKQDFQLFSLWFEVVQVLTGGCGSGEGDPKMRRETPTSRIIRP